MNALYHKNLAPIEVFSDGRRYKRFMREESVSITFRGQKVTGNLVNLSATGLLAAFASSVALPAISESVSAHIELDGKDNVFDIDGIVVRIRKPGEFESSNLVRVAIDYSGLDLAAQFRISKLINYLLVTDGNYNS
jgi:hypothetical protein